MPFVGTNRGKQGNAAPRLFALDDGNRSLRIKLTAKDGRLAESTDTPLAVANIDIRRFQQAAAIAPTQIEFLEMLEKAGGIAAEGKVQHLTFDLKESVRKWRVEFD